MGCIRFKAVRSWGGHLRWPSKLPGRVARVQVGVRGNQQ